MFFKNTNKILIIFVANLFIVSGDVYSGHKKLKNKIKKITSFPKTIVNAVKHKVNNEGVVDKGNLYRSGQLNSIDLAKLINKHGIKTVINLRGTNKDQSWWQDEKMVTESMGVKFCNIRMSADKFPTQKKLSKLLYMYDNAQRPILIHCKSGRDRTGEAAALWVLEKMNGSTKKALKELSFTQYQHVKSLHPYKTKLIKIWQGREWFFNGGYKNAVSLMGIDVGNQFYMPKA